MRQKSFELILERYSSDFSFVPGKLKNANFLHFSTGIKSVAAFSGGEVAADVCCMWGEKGVLV